LLRRALAREGGVEHFDRRACFVGHAGIGHAFARMHRNATSGNVTDQTLAV
jgi:hypothetical protein